ncbi:hypothetical protein JCM8097_004578 [Rhodosporidiobolus ruineniae]
MPHSLSLPSSPAATLTKPAAAPLSSASTSTSTAGVDLGAFTLDAGRRRERNEARVAATGRDFRTDTITVPSEEMLEFMRDASRGDDVYKEDEDTLELQERIAKLAGKEAALFCVSGTMTNQLAIRAHLSAPPYSILLDPRAHVHRSEAGGIAFHTGATTYTVEPANGHHMAVEEVMQSVVGEDGDVHGAPTRLVCVENTLSGMIYLQSELVALSAALSALSPPIPLHCDGARLWEVVAKTGMTLEEACRPFETVSLCLSKGLGAPVGSVLVGPKKLIDRATHLRKLFGGGIRQSGSLALAALYSLDHVLPQLPRTHALASRLAAGLTAPDVGCALELPVETNMVWIEPESAGFSLDELAEAAWREKGVRVSTGWGRLVVHYQVTEGAVEDLVGVARGLAASEGAREKRERWEEEHGEEEVRRTRERSMAFARGEWDGWGLGKSKKRGGYGTGKK